MDTFSCHRISSGSLLSELNHETISEKIGFIVYSVVQLLLLLLTVTVTQKEVRFFLFLWNK